MNHALVVTLLASGVAYGTPLLLGGLGELLAERSGILNLGLEGMMLVGAVVGFWISQSNPGPTSVTLALALLGAIAAGALMGLVHAIVTIAFEANQVVSGLALTIFGGAIGLSSYLASSASLGGQPGHHQFQPIDVFGLKDLPVVGPLLFHQDAMVYLSWALTLATVWYLYHSRFGLHLRSVGESPHSADSMGVNVAAYRYVHTVVGGAFAGMAGAYFSLALTPSWADGLTAGAGWIALGLVIFAFWRPGLLVVGAYLFGLVTSLGFTLQSRGVKLPPELFAALPYLLTIVVLVLVSSVWSRRRLGAPAGLGQPFRREE